MTAEKRTNPARAVELSCVVAGHTRRKDQSISIRLQTMQEGPVSLATWLDSRHNKEVVVLIADDAEAQALSYRGEVNHKGQTKSQKLRAHLYTLWKTLVEQGINVPDWPIYYDMTLDDIIAEY